MLNLCDWLYKKIKDQTPPVSTPFESLALIQDIFPLLKITVISDPVLAREMLMTYETKLQKSPAVEDYMISWALGPGAFPIDGLNPRSKLLRETIERQFSTKNVERFIPMLRKIVNDRISQLLQENLGKNVDIKPVIQEITLSFILKVLSDEINLDVGQRQLLVEFIEELMEYFKLRTVLPREISDKLLELIPHYKESRRLGELVDLLVYSIVDSHRPTNMNAVGELVSLIDGDYEVSLEGEVHQVKITRQIVRDALLTLILAGYHTTASTISSALAEIAGSPELQTELRNGGDEAIRKYALQALHKFGAVPFVQRWTEVPLTVEYEGRVVTLGPGVIMINIAGMNASGRNFSPFSIGDKSCIGGHVAWGEMQVIIGEFVKRCKIGLVVKPEQHYTGNLIGPGSVNVSLVPTED